MPIYFLKKFANKNYHKQEYSCLFGSIKGYYLLYNENTKTIQIQHGFIYIS